MLGWRQHILYIAKLKVFDIKDLNSIQAVEKINIYDFLEMLNYEFALK